MKTLKIKQKIAKLQEELKIAEYSLDERYNRETGDLEFHNWLCPSCQAKLSATKETCLMMIDDEIEFLKEEYKFMKEIRNFGDSYNFFVGRLRIIELRLSAIQKLRSELE